MKFALRRFLVRSLVLLSAGLSTFVVLGTSAAAQQQFPASAYTHPAGTIGEAFGASWWATTPSNPTSGYLGAGPLVALLPNTVYTVNFWLTQTAEAGWPDDLDAVIQVVGGSNVLLAQRSLHRFDFLGTNVNTPFQITFNTGTNNTNVEFLTYYEAGAATQGLVFNEADLSVANSWCEQGICSCAPYEEINGCVARAPSGSVVELQVGNYTVTTPVVIEKPVSIMTQQTQQRPKCWSRSGTNISYDLTHCANVVAAATLGNAAGSTWTTSGMFTIGQISVGTNFSGVTLDHLIINANAGARGASPCGSPTNSDCLDTIKAWSVNNITVTNNAEIANPGSLNQGTGYANHFTDVNNLFVNSNLFYQAGNLPVAVAYGSQGGAANLFEVDAMNENLNVTIQNNDFIDGSDGNLVLGLFANRAIVGDVSMNNSLQWYNQNTSALLVYYNGSFDAANTAGTASMGNPYGAAGTFLSVHNNVIDCDNLTSLGVGSSNKLCIRGLDIGGMEWNAAQPGETTAMSPWEQSQGAAGVAGSRLLGGYFSTNVIYNARIGLLIDGVGDVTQTNSPEVINNYVNGETEMYRRFVMTNSINNFIYAGPVVYGGTYDGWQNGTPSTWGFFNIGSTAASGFASYKLDYTDSANMDLCVWGSATCLLAPGVPFPPIQN